MVPVDMKNIKVRKNKTALLSSFEMFSLLEIVTL